MVYIARVNVAWQNWPGAPGLSQFYVANTALQASVDGIRAFYNTLSTMLPSGLTVTVPATGDLINAPDGAIVGAWSAATPPAVVTGSGSGTYAGNAGAVVHWLTDAVARGRRVRGRTFLVPLISTQFESNGSLSASCISGISGAASTLRTALGTNFFVWHRPVKAHTEYNRKTGVATAIPASDGTECIVTGQRVPDLAISLRSRRI